MSKIELISSNDKFRKENNENWLKISDFWIKNPLSQKADLSLFVTRKINDIYKENSSITTPIEILDVGCGEGWILRILENEKIPFKYLGVDSNPEFIRFLQSKHKKNNIRFLQLDAENLLNHIDCSSTRFDVIINSFSLFEMPKYAEVLKNETKLLKDLGNILIFTINPLTQLMAISDSFAEFVQNSKLYAEYGSSGKYQKLIDTGQGSANYIYFGILHSMSSYFTVLKDMGFKMTEFEEVNMLADIVPKIYEYGRFQK